MARDVRLRRPAVSFGSFDRVIALEVIEHLYDPRHFLRRAFEVAEAGRPTRPLDAVPRLPQERRARGLRHLDAHFTALWDGGHIKFFSRARSDGPGRGGLHRPRVSEARVACRSSGSRCSWLPRAAGRCVRPTVRFLLLNQFYPPDAAPTGVYLHDVARGLVAAGHEVRRAHVAAGLRRERAVRGAGDEGRRRRTAAGAAPFGHGGGSGGRRATCRTCRSRCRGGRGWGGAEQCSR